MSPSAPAPILSDADWRALKAALDRVRSGTGRPFTEERMTLEAVLWRHRAGGRWREVPPAFGPWWRAAQLHYRWAKTGLWTKLRAALIEAGRVDLAEHFAWDSGSGEG
jgi:transposase